MTRLRITSYGVYKHVDVMPEALRNALLALIESSMRAYGIDDVTVVVEYETEKE